MKCPFPGMDPYLETPAYWPDFHHTFIACWREAIADALPGSYEARVDERVNLARLDDDVVKLIVPDVAISQRKPPSRRRGTTPAGAVGVLEPEIVPQEAWEESRQGYIEILHRDDASLVAVLELLSPANKTGDGFFQYRCRRKRVLHQKVRLFELDLLHEGDPPLRPRRSPPADYRALVTRAESRGKCGIYSISMRDPLPTLPIPLRAPDPDIFVDLQAVFATTYQRGRYARSIRYNRPVSIPAPAETLAWIAERAGT